MTALLLLLLAGGDLGAAQKALDEGRPREAIELLGDLAEGENPDKKAQLILGRAQLALREYVAAVEPLVQALEANPDDKELLRDIAWACWGASRHERTFQQAYLEDALRYAKKSGDPALVADLLYDLSRWEEALAAYAEVKETDANRYDLHSRRAHCLASLERKDEARAEYAQALDEALRRARLREAFETAFRANLTGKLLTWLDERLATEPDNVELRLYRGYAREALGMLKEAVEDLREAVRLAPGHADAKHRLARALAYLGSKQQRPEAMREAEQMLRANLEEDPTDPMSWESMQWLAYWAWLNGDTERSYELMKLLLAIDPGDRQVVLNFTANARRLGKYDEAAKAFRTALADDPEDPDLLNDLAILRDGEGREDEAIRIWRQILDLDPTNRNALENLFTKAWERGDQEAMQRHLQAGLDVAEAGDDPGYLRRWRWFRDRLRWAPAGFRRER